MTYQVFSRRWWEDAACTVPGLGQRKHIAFTETEEEAQSLCHAYNCNEAGERIHRPYGLAYEYTSR